MRLKIRLMDATRRALQSTPTLGSKFLNLVDEQDAAIISWNWDVLIEATCESIDIAYTYDNRNTSALQVFKPHGSLNLVEVTQEEFDDAASSRNVHSLLTLMAYNGRLVLQARNALDAANRVVFPFASHNPVFVEPTYDKRFESFRIEKQWEGAENVLTNANEVFIIGYSLPPSDVRSRELLRRTIAAKIPDSRGKCKRVVIVDINAEQLGNQNRDVFGQELEIIQNPWEKSLDKLIA